MASSLEEVLFPEWNRSCVKEMRDVLEKKRSAGHPYVDIRRDGRRDLLYCCLCRAPCFDGATLECHLKGNRHAKMVCEAQQILMRPNAWPFNDGMHFVHVDESEEVNLDVTSHVLVIPDVLQNNRAADIVVIWMGFGLIRARSIEKEDFSCEIHRIWCEWFGKEISTQIKVPEHDVAVVTFPYDYNLGRNVILDPGYLKRQDSATKSPSDRKRLLDRFDVCIRESMLCMHRKIFSGKGCGCPLEQNQWTVRL